MVLEKISNQTNSKIASKSIFSILILLTFLILNLIIFIFNNTNF